MSTTPQRKIQDQNPKKIHQGRVHHTPSSHHSPPTTTEGAIATHTLTQPESQGSTHITTNNDYTTHRTPTSTHLFFILNLKSQEIFSYP
jgi:hypothetical protein